MTTAAIAKRVYHESPAPRNNENRETLPSVKTPANVVNIEGIVFAHPGRVYALGESKASIDAGKPRIEQNFDLAGEGKLRGWAQSPYILREIDAGLMMAYYVSGLL